MKVSIKTRNRASQLSDKERENFKIDPCIAQKDAIKSGKIAFHGLTHGHYPGVKLSDKLLPGLRSLGFWDATGTQDWHMEPHRNDGLEIVLLETGKMDFTVNKTLHHLTPGSLTVTRPWQMHCHGVSHVGPGRLHWLILDVNALGPNEQWQWPDWIMLMPKDCQQLMDRLRRDPKCIWQGRPEIISAFQTLAACLVDPSLNKQISQITLSINQLLLTLLAEMESSRGTTTPQQTSTEHAIDQFMEELKMNPSLLSETWTLETMAKRCGVGCTTLVRYCHHLTNTTPMDYLNHCRLEWAAKELIKSPEDAITEIAFRVGFSSSPYFATQFRRLYGLTPSEYRNQKLKVETNQKS